MSVILDALKKLDREKSHRGNATSNIAVDILKPDLAAPAKKIRFYFLIVALTAIATLAVTYAVMIGLGFSPGSSPSKSVRDLSLNQQIAPAPPESKLRTESSGSASPPAETRAAAVSREPIRDDRKKENQVQPKMESPGEDKGPSEIKTPVGIKPPAALTPAVPKASAESMAPVEPKPSAAPKSPAESKAPAETKAPVVSMEEKKPVVPEKVEPVPGSARKTSEATPKVSTATPPSLKLSAIVWYEDPSMRFAMINGVKATEGSDIDGVKVVEIKATSVRFLHDGRYFDISMTR
jgi:hypothetical protein